MSNPTYDRVLDSVVHHCCSEIKLLNGWADHVRSTSCCAIVFHNGNNFDVPYLFERAKVVGAATFCENLSPLPCMSARFYRKTRTTAEGLREWGLFDLPGLCLLDSMEAVRAEGYKLSSYSLKEVVWRFLSVSASPVSRDNETFVMDRELSFPPDQQQNLMYRAIMPDLSVTTPTCSTLTS